jgi:hypothetical protein
MPTEICMNHLLKFNNFLLNGRKSHHEEDDRLKKSLTLSKNKALSGDKESNNPYMPKSEWKSENFAKEEELIKDIKYHTYGFGDHFMKNQGNAQAFINHKEI